MADTQLAAKDRASAIQSLEKALGVQANFTDAQRALIALYVADGQQPRALEIAKTVQKQRPKEDLGYVMEADIHANARRWDKAIAALRAGLGQINTTPLAMKLHTGLQAAGKAQEAEQFSQQWRHTHPQDAAFDFYLGDQALQRKNYAVAEQYFFAVHTLQPENPVVLNNLAWVRGKLKKPEALALAEQAVALEPRQPLFLDTLASLHADLGEYGQALELQTRALALQPDNPLLKLNLAIIHSRIGNRETAKKLLDELAALGDSFSGRQDVLQAQKQLALPLPLLTPEQPAKP